VLITVIAYYPHGESENVGKKFIEVMSKYPDDPTAAEPILYGAVNATTEGIRVISVAAVKNGKVKEAIDLATRRMLEYSNAIAGFRYTLDVSYDVVEAMGILNMKSPV
jgi:hypothetical protein